MPMAGVESVGIGTYIKTGSRYESPRISGLSHFLEHMVFKGTKKYLSHKDTSYLEGLGAIQNAWTDVDATAYWCKIVAERWAEGLDLMSELALNPTFPSQDLEIERGVILEEINRREDRPDEIVSEGLQEKLFVGNPLEMTVLGRAEVIKSVTRRDFIDYHSQQYVAGRMVVVVAGKLANEAKIRATIEKLYGKLAPDAGKDFQTVDNNLVSSEAAVHFKKTADQIHFEIGMRAFNSKDKRRFALAVLTSYLGQGLSSRLFTELREKRGLCYSVQASASHMEDVGMWSVYAGVAKDKFSAALVAVWEEMKRLREVHLDENELKAAKEKIRGQIVFAKENPIYQMEFFARQALDKPEEMIDYDTFISSLNEVNSDEIREVARELFKADNLRLSIVGETTQAQGQEMVQLLRD